MKSIGSMVAIMLMIAGANAAQAEWFDGTCLSHSKAEGCCDPKWSTEKVKKHCWDVEAKAVCIPAVRLPWDCSCTLKPGTARCVNTLKKHDYECEKNVVKWDASGVICPQQGCGCKHCQDGQSSGCGTAQRAPRN